MPANLNALVRYRAINNCLSSGRRYDISELINACSYAVSGYCGRRTSVSERTVRNDLKVMKSELLGFNAPIEQRGGLYFYSDMNYALVNFMISEDVLLMKLIDLLTEVSQKVSHPEMEDILKRLRAVKARSSDKGISMAKEIDEPFLKNKLPGMMSFSLKKPYLPESSGVTWGDIFRILG